MLSKLAWHSLAQSKATSGAPPSIGRPQVVNTSMAHGVNTDELGWADAAKSRAAEETTFIWLLVRKEER